LERKYAEPCPVAQKVEKRGIGKQKGVEGKIKNLKKNAARRGLLGKKLG